MAVARIKMCQHRSSQGRSGKRPVSYTHLDRRALLKKEFRRNLSDRVTQVGKRYAEAMTYAANYPFSSGYTIPIKK